MDAEFQGADFWDAQFDEKTKLQSGGESETIVINKTKSANCVKDAQRLSRLMLVFVFLFTAYIFAP
jgi:hypothetical protein